MRHRFETLALLSPGLEPRASASTTLKNLVNIIVLERRLTLTSRIRVNEQSLEADSFILDVFVDGDLHSETRVRIRDGELERFKRSNEAASMECLETQTWIDMHDREMLFCQFS